MNYILFPVFHVANYHWQELKTHILTECVSVIVSHVIVPGSGWDGGTVERDPNNDHWWSGVFKNTSGVLRWVGGIAMHI